MACAGLALAIWALAAPWYRTIEGALGKQVCVPLSLGLGCILVGLCLGTEWRNTACWLALAAVGQSAALSLIDAGQRLRYQHYKEPADLLRPENAAMLAILAVEAVAAVAGTRTLWRRCAAWARANISVLGLAGIAALAVFSAVAVTRSPGLFAFQVVLACAVETVALLTVVAACVAAPAAALRFPSVAKAWKVAALGSVWVLLVTALLSYFVYADHPHVPDEVSYVMQARYFAQGMLAMPALPAPRLFDLDLMTFEPGRWYSPFPPGWPAVLALGFRAGAPWLVNPLLAALGIAGVYLLFRELRGERFAAACAVVFAVSPWYLFLGMSLMSHILTIDFTMLAALSVARAKKIGSAWWALAGGLATGAVSVIRPLDGAIVAVLLGLWALDVATWRRRAALAGALALGAAITGAVSFPYNHALTGRALKFPVDDYFDRYYYPGVNALGFGANRGLNWGIDPFPGHGLRDVAVNAQLNASSVNTELLGWGCGSLLLIGLAVFSRRSQRFDRQMAAAILVVIGAYSLYWFSGGPDFGARYWFLAILPGVALTVRGLEILGWPEAGLGKRALVGAAGLSFVALTAFVPWRAIDKYHDYLWMRPDVRELARARNFGRSLVLIRGERHPDYASAAVYNSLDPDAPGPVYVWERDAAARDEALRAFPGRPVWTLNGPSLTGRGFEIAAAPAARK